MLPPQSSSDTESLPAWPELPFGEWKETCATLRRWSQIIGTIRLVPAFFRSTHEAAANPGRWNHAALELAHGHGHP